MAVQLNKTYIQTISEKTSKQLKPVIAQQFVSALEQTYTVAKTTEALKWVLSAEQKNLFSGMAAFQERFISALGRTDAALNPDDQKYLADITFRVSIGQIKPVKL